MNNLWRANHRELRDIQQNFCCIEYLDTHIEQNVLLARFLLRLIKYSCLIEYPPRGYFQFVQALALCLPQPASCCCLGRFNFTRLGSVGRTDARSCFSPAASESRSRSFSIFFFSFSDLLLHSSKQGSDLIDLRLTRREMENLIFLDFWSHS